MDSRAPRTCLLPFWRLCRVMLALWFSAGLGASSPWAGGGSRHIVEDVLLPPGLRCLANDYGQNPVFCGKTQSPNGKYVLDANRSHQRISATARAALASSDSVDAACGPSPSEAMTQHARGGAAPAPCQHRASAATGPHQRACRTDRCEIGRHGSIPVQLDALRVPASAHGGMGSGRPMKRPQARPQGVEVREARFSLRWRDGTTSTGHDA